MIEALVGASDGRVCLIELQGSLTVEGKIIGVGDYLVFILLQTVWSREGEVVGQ